MSQHMNVRATELPGVLLVEPQVFRDARGVFLETYHERRYRAAGIEACFVQDNYSSSAQHTLRGLHAQCLRPQAKLVRVVRGAIFDVVVDIRLGSPTFAHWFGATLTEDNAQQLYVPEGFAHGFCVTSDQAHVEYKCSAFYDADDEMAIAWDDPAIGIDWPVEHPLLSARDRAALPLERLRDRLPSY